MAKKVAGIVHRELLGWYGFYLRAASAILRSMKTPVLFPALACLCAGCALRSLNPRGEVALWTSGQDRELRQLAGSIPGLVFSIIPNDEPWTTRMTNAVDAPDLVYAEWGSDLAKYGADGLLADLSGYWRRMQSVSKLMPGFQSLRGPKGTFLIPAAVYTWGLFYNTSVLDACGVSFPESMESMEGILAKIKEKGRVPIALGASPGWPALAWLSYLDLRMNGTDAYRRLWDGERAFDDRSLAAVYERLGTWRDEEWFDPSAGTKGWRDALSDVESGKAAFALLGAFAMDRISDPDTVRWAPFPSSSTGKGKNSELVVIQGFALSAKAREPEAAVAFADAVVGAGSAGLTDDAFRVPAAAKTLPPDSPAIKKAQDKLLEACRDFLPQLDRVLPQQAAYDTSRVMLRFFAANSSMTAEELAAGLKAARP
jgi:ABC-type glycerol-3-phosphate transport system substrate-binding protein